MPRSYHFDDDDVDGYLLLATRQRLVCQFDDALRQPGRLRARRDALDKLTLYAGREIAVLLRDMGDFVREQAVAISVQPILTCAKHDMIGNRECFGVQYRGCAVCNRVVMNPYVLETEPVLRNRDKLRDRVDGL